MSETTMELPRATASVKTSRLLQDVFGKYPATRMRKVVNIVYDMVKKANPDFTEEEIIAEMDFIERDTFDIKELDRYKTSWNIGRIRYERFLKRMLSTRKFQRLDIVRGDLANLRMQMNLWAAIEYVVARLMALENKGTVRVDYNMDVSSMQVKPSDTPRKRWRNCSPWNREPVDVRDDAYLPNRSGFVDGRNP